MKNYTTEEQQVPLMPPARRKSTTHEEAQEHMHEINDMVATCCRHDNAKLCCSALGVIVCLCIGGGVFSLLEKPEEYNRMDKFVKDETAILEALNGNRILYEFIRNHSNAFKPSVGTVHWGMGGSMFFGLMIITTLGVSEEFPKTPGGQVFCALFALCGIPLMGMFLMLLGRKIVTIIASCVNCCCTSASTREQWVQETFDSFDTDNNGHLDEIEFRTALRTMEIDDADNDESFNRILLAVDLDGDQEIDIDEFKLAVAMLDAQLTGPTLRNFRMRIILVLAGSWLLLGTVLFAYSENWHLYEAFYFTVTILTAIGTGDYVPKTNGGYAMFAVFVICGLGIFSTILTVVASQYRDVEHAIFESQLKKREQFIQDKKEKVRKKLYPSDRFVKSSESGTKNESKFIKRV